MMLLALFLLLAGCRNEAEGKTIGTNDTYAIYANTTTSSSNFSDIVATWEEVYKIFHQFRTELATSAFLPALQELDPRTQLRLLDKVVQKVDDVVNKTSRDVFQLLVKSRYSGCQQELKALEANQQKLLTNQRTVMNWLQRWLIICPSGWTRVGDRCFYMTTDYTTGEGGDAFCRRKHERARLISIHNQNEDDAVLSLLRNADEKSGALIGLRRSDQTASGWAWSDGTPVDYVNWSPGEPNNLKGKESCANKDDNEENLGWNDLNCETPLQAICAITLR